MNVGVAEAEEAESYDSSEAGGMAQSRDAVRARHRAASMFLFIWAMGAGQFCMAIEQAQYSVVTSTPPYEIRDYASSVVAIVDVDGSRSDAVNSGFRLLADYIFGDNKERSKIAMTAPVTQAPLHSSWVVRFMMPAGYTLNSLPIPVDTRVHFEQIPAHRVAVIRFSGFWSDANLTTHEAQLRDWMQSRHLTPGSPATYAYYDPPWTPWFMRKNEVLIDIAASTT